MGDPDNKPRPDGLADILNSSEGLSPAETERVEKLLQLGADQEAARARLDSPTGAFSAGLSEPSAPEVNIFRAATPAEELEEALRQRDQYQRRSALRLASDHEDFIEYLDSDAMLAPGSKVLVGDVEVKLLVDTPIEAPAFRDEGVFAEHLARTKNLGVNAKYLRSRYNGNGSPVGINESHPLNRLDARIAQLQEEVRLRELKAKEEEGAKKSAPAEKVE